MPVSLYILRNISPRRTLRRAVNIVTSLHLVPALVVPYSPRVPWSELNPLNYSSPMEFCSSVRDLIYPVHLPFMGALQLPFQIPDMAVPDSDREAWFFINGIGTDRNVIQLNGRALSSLFRRKIYLMHNPSDGLVLDLLEASLGLDIQLGPGFEADMARILISATEVYDRVVLITHSQGSIIGTTALEIMVSKLQEEGLEGRLSRIEFYSFGGASDTFEVPWVYAEHFFNRWDFVPHLGVFANGDQFRGRRFEARTTGHLLNTHYLDNLVAGRFVSEDGEPSRLVEKLNPTPPAPGRTFLQWLINGLVGGTGRPHGTRPLGLEK